MKYESLEYILNEQQKVSIALINSFLLDITDEEVNKIPFFKYPETEYNYVINHAICIDFLDSSRNRICIYSFGGAPFRMIK